MDLYEKSLELNITHELLTLADAWYWFLINTPLWHHWEPRNRWHFFKCPPSTAGGLSIYYEGKSDPTGEKGGGYDVRIKASNGNLLFIQYKKGELALTSPDPKSIFKNPPSEHFKFKINNKNDQHFKLRELAEGIGKDAGNAVVYALPLIKDMNELEANTGKLIRKTKFISIVDIDKQAALNSVSFTSKKEHNFRICKSDMNRCEVNFFFFQFQGKDRSAEVISDIIATKFQKILSAYIDQYKSNIDAPYRQLGRHVSAAYSYYLQYLLNYFEVSLNDIDNIHLNTYVKPYTKKKLQYQSLPKDVEIIKSVFTVLKKYDDFITSIDSMLISELIVPRHTPQILLPVNDNGIYVRLEKKENTQEDLSELNYLVI